MSAVIVVSASASKVSELPFKSCAPTPPPMFVSTTSVPLQYKIFVPLSVVAQVTPV